MGKHFTESGRRENLSQDLVSRNGGGLGKAVSGYTFFSLSQFRSRKIRRLDNFMKFRNVVFEAPKL